MAKKCERCGVSIPRDRFCPKHAKAVLIEAERSGYLQPLRVMTQDGPVRLAKSRFLTLKPKTARNCPAY
jgi:hypothetical protein